MLINNKLIKFNKIFNLVWKLKFFLKKLEVEGSHSKKNKKLMNVCQNGLLLRLKGLYIFFLHFFNPKNKKLVEVSILKWT